MPLLRTSNSDLIQIDLPAEGEWVKVKRKLGKDDERAIVTHLLRGQTVPYSTVDEGLSDIDVGALADSVVFARMEVVVKAWSFSDPITPANLRALDDASVALLRERLEAMYEPPRMEEDAKNSGEPGPAPSTMAETSQASLAG